jgi:hypothetical protein
LPRNQKSIFGNHFVSKSNATSMPRQKFKGVDVVRTVNALPVRDIRQKVTNYTGYSNNCHHLAICHGARNSKIHDCFKSETDFSGSPAPKKKVIRADIHPVCLDDASLL